MKKLRRVIVHIGGQNARYQVFSDKLKQLQVISYTNPFYVNGIKFLNEVTFLTYTNEIDATNYTIELKDPTDEATIIITELAE
jgi:hypothetical protein